MKSQSNTLVRDCITMALMQLIEEKPMSAISITELTKRAGVSRMAYYRNYSSKEEIFESHLAGIFDSYKREASVKTGAYSDYENLLVCFRYFGRYSDFMCCLTKCGMGHRLLDALTDYLTETYWHDGTMAGYYKLTAFAGALYGTYIKWISRGKDEPPETMARVMFRIFG